MATLNFDARSVDPQQGRLEPIPKGWYIAMIEESDLQPTKSGTGMYLKVTATVLDGQYKGRKLFKNLNIRNESKQAEEIAHKELSAICYAANVLQVQDSRQLHNIPMKVRVKIRTDKTGQYDDQNEIVEWRGIEYPTPATDNVGIPPAFAAAPFPGSAPAPAAAPPYTPPYHPPYNPAAATPAAPPWTPPPAVAPAPAAAPPVAYNAPAQAVPVAAPPPMTHGGTGAPPPWANQVPPAGTGAAPPWAGGHQ